MDRVSFPGARAMERSWLSPQAHTAEQMTRLRRLPSRVFAPRVFRHTRLKDNSAISCTRTNATPMDVHDVVSFPIFGASGRVTRLLGLLGQRVFRACDATRTRRSVRRGTRRLI